MAIDFLKFAYLFSFIFMFIISCSTLQKHELGEQMLTDCQTDRRSKIQEITYEYKTVYDPYIKKDVHLRAYVFFNPATAQLSQPGVAMFHGGGWEDGSPVMWFPAALRLASQGFITVSFQYRLKNINHSTPLESLADAKSALEWLADHVSALHIDAEQISAAGDSAGAYLILRLAMLKDPTLPKIKKVVALYPVIDPGLKGVMDLPPLGSVVNDKLPPTLILQGQNDKNPHTPPIVAKRFCESVNQLAGHEICKTVFFKGDEYFHGFFGAKKTYSVAMTSMEQFFGLTKSKNMVDQDSTCDISEHAPLFQSWLKDFGYTTHQTSVW